jgi:hypothetical protein
MPPSTAAWLPHGHSHASSHKLGATGLSAMYRAITAAYLPWKYRRRLLNACA